MRIRRKGRIVKKYRQLADCKYCCIAIEDNYYCRYCYMSITSIVTCLY